MSAHRAYDPETHRPVWLDEGPHPHHPLPRHTPAIHVIEVRPTSAERHRAEQKAYKARTAGK